MRRLLDWYLGAVVILIVTLALTLLITRMHACLQ